MKKRIDIEAGEFTYGQRIALGRLLSDNSKADWEKLEGTFDILYNKHIKAAQYRHYLPEFEKILQGVQHWMQLEAQLLHYEPSPDEIAAGCNNLQTSEMGSVYKLARDFGVLPNVILDMQYADVFAVLWNDAEMAAYNKRLMNIQNRKR